MSGIVSKQPSGFLRSVTELQWLPYPLMGRTTYNYYRHRPKRRSRRRGWFAFGWFVVIIAVVYVSYACFRPLTYAMQIVITSPGDGATQIVWPQSGQVALGVEDQGVVAVSPQERKAPIASLTKLVTALAVLEKRPLKPGEQGETIRFTAADSQTYQEVIMQDGAAIAVTPGQTMTERQALTAMILASANNIAITLVERVFGSERAYIDYANDMLKRHGFTQTHVADASGLGSGTVSTPSELIKLAEFTMRSQVLAEITELPEIHIPGFPTVANINHGSKLVGSVHALKVGLTDEAGSCLLFWVDVQKPGVPPDRVYGAIINQPEFFTLQRYVNYIAQEVIPANFTYGHIADAGARVATYIDKSGDLIAVSAPQEIKIPHWRGQRINLDVADTGTAPKLKVTTGTATKYYGLALDERPNFAATWRLLHPF